MLSERPLLATMVIASFGTSAGYLEQLFEIKVEHDPNIPLPKPEAQPRFGKKEHIHHIFRDGPQSPPAILTLVFSLAVLATVPLLFGMVRLLRSCVMVANPADTSPNSGSNWAGMSIPSAPPCRRPRPRMSCSSAPYWLWKASSSCTIPDGTCSRRSRPLASLASSPLSAADVLSPRFKNVVLQVRPPSRRAPEYFVCVGIRCHAAA